MPRREVVMTVPAFMLQNDGVRMPTLEIAFAHVAQLAHRVASGHEIAFSHVAQFAHRVASGHENAAFCAASFAAGDRRLRCRRARLSLYAPRD